MILDCPSFFQTLLAGRICCVDEAQEDGGEATKKERIQKKDVDLAGRTDAQRHVGLLCCVFP